MTYPGPIPLKYKILLFFPVQIASGFFFPISIGKIIQWVRERDIATVLWNFISDCGKAGLSRFYASRDTNDAKNDLESRFDHHKEGDILLTGPSLRLFFAPDTHFRKVIERNILQYKEGCVNIRIVNCDMNANMCLPIRSFVEEFSPNGEHPRGKRRGQFDWQFEDFDWKNTVRSINNFNLERFLVDFYKDYGITGKIYKCRCVTDLESVQRGIHTLNGKTERALIHARTTQFAPYFTAVIFPDVCYYTPNMLCPEQPVNMPMLAFLRGGPVYDKILTHFKFLWWSGEHYENLADPLE